MFPRFREQIGTALDLIVEFSTLGEYRLAVTPRRAPWAPPSTLRTEHRGWEAPARTPSAPRFAAMSRRRPAWCRSRPPRPCGSTWPAAARAPPRGRSACAHAGTPAAARSQGSASRSRAALPGGLAGGLEQAAALELPPAPRDRPGVLPRSSRPAPRSARRARIVDAATQPSSPRRSLRLKIHFVRHRCRAVVQLGRREQPLVVRVALGEPSRLHGVVVLPHSAGATGSPRTSANRARAR